MINFLDEIIEPIESGLDSTTVIILSITAFVVILTGIIVSFLIKNSNKGKEI